MQIFRYYRETSSSFVRHGHQMRPNPNIILHLYLENMNNNIIFASTQLGVLRGTMRNETLSIARENIFKRKN